MQQWWHRWARQQTCVSATGRERQFRLVVCLAVVIVLSTFDLAFTQSQMARGNFREANILAASAVSSGPATAAAYKVVLLGLGALLLYRCRNHWTSEAGAWILVVCHVALMVWWAAYLDSAEICSQDPFSDWIPITY